jgi:thiaminase/transcriptional activator TenA
MRARDQLARHEEAWREATLHPFLDAVHEGTLPAGAFETWLVQDYLFVVDGLGFQSRLVPRAPRRDQALLIGGLVALEAELGWFEEKAQERGLDLGATHHPSNAAYRDHLITLESASYPAAITALWALERAYLDAWRSAVPGHPDYREFVEHWTTPEFEKYVSGLEDAADNALKTTNEEGQREAERAFLEIARLERGFWQMALPEDARGSGAGA